jgi:hypothetical protein
MFLKISGSEIRKKLTNLSSLSREKTKLYNFEKICKEAAYTMKGGLQNSVAIKDCLIDHSIPFLPLEKQHVIKCIQRDFLLIGVQSPNEEKIE